MKKMTMTVEFEIDEIPFETELDERAHLARLQGKIDRLISQEAIIKKKNPCKITKAANIYGKHPEAEAELF